MIFFVFEIVFIFDDVFFVFGYLQVYLNLIELRSIFCCGIELNILLFFVVMDMVIELRFVIVIV